METDLSSKGRFKEYNIESGYFQNELFIGAQPYPHCSFAFEELNRYAVETKVGPRPFF